MWVNESLVTPISVTAQAKEGQPRSGVGTTDYNYQTSRRHLEQYQQQIGESSKQRPTAENMQENIKSELNLSQGMAHKLYRPDQWRPGEWREGAYLRGTQWTGQVWHIDDKPAPGQGEEGWTVALSCKTKANK